MTFKQFIVDRFNWDCRIEYSPKEITTFKNSYVIYLMRFNLNKESK